MTSLFSNNSFLKRKPSKEDNIHLMDNSSTVNHSGIDFVDVERGSGEMPQQSSGKQGAAWSMDMLVQVLGCDLRSLAAMRVGISILIILDLYVRSLYMHDHYTDLGATPAYTIIDNNPYTWSLYFINSSLFFVRILFVCNWVAAFSLLIGYRTRLASFLVWVFMTSIHVRNPMVLNGGDDFFRLMVFWMMFLPLGAKFSIDSILNVEQINRRSNINHKSVGYSPIAPTTSTFPVTDSTGSYYLSFATMGVMFQFCFVYIFTALLKTGAEWRSEYSSVWFALNLDQFVTRTGVILREYLALGQFLTVFSFYWELYGYLLFFIPLRRFHGPLRTFCVLGFWCLHIGFGMCLELGFFMYIPGMSVLCFLPSWFWDQVNRIINTPQRTSTVIYYDSSSAAPDNGEGIRRVLSIYKTLFLIQSTPLLPFQQQPLQRDPIDSMSTMHEDKLFTEMKMNDSWICVENTLTLERVYGIQAFAQLIRLSPLLQIFSFILNLRPTARFYHWITHRPLFVQGTSWKLIPKLYPTKPVVVTRKYWKEIFCFFILLYIFNWNCSSLYDYSVSENIRWVAPALKIDQYWSMFSPYPSKDDGWLVIPGVLMDGTEVDVYNRKHDKVTYDKPELVSPMFPTQRWRKFLMNLQSYHHKEKRLHYGRYLCREWNWYGGNEGKKQLKSFRIMFMLELTPAFPKDGIIPKDPPAEPIELWSHQCF